MTPWTTTLADLSALRPRPCTDGWRKLLRYLGKTKADDEPLLFSTILESNGISDALWCLRAVKGRDRDMRLYAVWCGRRVQHRMTDPRSIATLDVAERYANGQATKEELAAAEDAAWGAARAAGAATERAAAWAATGSAAGAADRAAAWAAIWVADRAAQSSKFLQMVSGDPDWLTREIQP